MEGNNMIIISVDYEGSRSIENYPFTSFDKAYLDKLDEIESYDGKIDRIIITRGTNGAHDSSGVFTQIKNDELVNTTNVGVAIRKGKYLAKTK